MLAFLASLCLSVCIKSTKSILLDFLFVPKLMFNASNSQLFIISVIKFSYVLGTLFTRLLVY